MVVLYMRAWIEIGEGKIPQSEYFGRPLHEGVAWKNESKIALVDFVSPGTQKNCTEFVASGRQIGVNVESIQQIG